jgi:hypothetical protein
MSNYYTVLRNTFHLENLKPSSLLLVDQNWVSGQHYTLKTFSESWCLKCLFL